MRNLCRQSDPHWRGRQGRGEGPFPTCGRQGPRDPCEGPYALKKYTYAQSLGLGQNGHLEAWGLAQGPSSEPWCCSGLQGQGSQH
jgi:hypothetical protein